MKRYIMVHTVETQQRSEFLNNYCNRIETLFDGGSKDGDVGDYGGNIAPHKRGGLNEWTIDENRGGRKHVKKLASMHIKWHCCTIDWILSSLPSMHLDFWTCTRTVCFSLHSLWKWFTISDKLYVSLWCLWCITLEWEHQTWGEIILRGILLAHCPYMCGVRHATKYILSQR